MFTKIIMAVVVLGAASAFAKPCTEEELSQKITAAALSIETLNGGGQPLTQELYSLNSEQGAYVVVLSYSGVQNQWKVKASSESCLIESVSKIDMK